MPHCRSENSNYACTDFRGWLHLEHTLGLESSQWRLLDLCHKRRNQAEYEGHLDISSQLIDDLLAVTEEVLERVEKLGDIKE